DSLERDGHVVASELTGAAGRQRAMDESWDLVLCDIGLPDVNGFVLARQLRQAGIDVPLVALSGHAADEDRKLGLESGFDNYLTKPIKPSDLRAEVRFQGARPRPVTPRADTAPALVETPAVVPARVELAGPRRRGVLGGLVVVAFALAPQHRWPLVPAVLLGIAAAARFVTGASLIPAPLEPFLVPVVLIGVGAYLLAEPRT